MLFAQAYLIIGLLYTLYKTVPIFLKTKETPTIGMFVVMLFFWPVSNLLDWVYR